jgi:hypothetical protein
MCTIKSEVGILEMPQFTLHSNKITMNKQALLGRGSDPLQQLLAVDHQKLQELEERLFERLQSSLLQTLQVYLGGQQLPQAATANGTRGTFTSHPAPTPTPSATVANLLGLTPAAPPGSRLLPFLSEVNAGHIHALIAHKVLEPTQNNPNAANNTTISNTTTTIDQTALIGSTGTVTVTGSFPSGCELKVDLAGSTFNGHLLFIPNPSSASTAADSPNDNNNNNNQQREQEDQPFFPPPGNNNNNNNVNLQSSIDTNHHHQQQQQLTMEYSMQVLPDNAIGHNNNGENRVNNDDEDDAPGAVKRRRIDTLSNDNLNVGFPAGGEKTPGKPTTATGAADGGEGGAEPSPFPTHLSHHNTQHQQHHPQVKSPQDPVTSFELWKTYHVELMRKKMAIDQNQRNRNNNDKTNGDGKETEKEEQVLERMLQDKWHSLSDQEKSIYEVLSQEDEKRWECEMQAYLAGMRAHVEQGGGFGGQISLLGSGCSGGGGAVTTNTNVGVFIQSLPPGAPVVPQ